MYTYSVYRNPYHQNALVCVCVCARACVLCWWTVICSNMMYTYSVYRNPYNQNGADQYALLCYDLQKKSDNVYFLHILTGTHTFLSLQHPPPPPPKIMVNHSPHHDNTTTETIMFQNTNVCITFIITHDVVQIYIFFRLLLLSVVLVFYRIIITLVSKINVNDSVKIYKLKTYRN